VSLLRTEQWWYLSFADAERFLGAVIVRAFDKFNAVNLATTLGINPGGDVMAVALGEDPGPCPVNQLLSKAALGPGDTVGELEARGIYPGENVEFVD
jgi:hypothetical protein